MGRIRVAGALVAVLALALLVAPGSAAAAEPEPSFCAQRSLHDYLVPLHSMPKLRELPFRARNEPIFRQGVRIGAEGPSLAINGGSAGYQLQWDKNPHWDLRMSFAQVNGRGKVIANLGERHIRTAEEAPGLGAEPKFALPRTPGFFRTILVIRDASGRKIATFGNYYRVMKPNPSAVLVADAPSYAPGSTLYGRVENPGAAIVLFGEEYRVEQQQGETWVSAPAASGAFPAPIQFIAAGVTSRQCLDFAVPSSMTPGRYRIALEVVFSWPAQPKQLRPILYAEFEVTPPTT